MRFMPAARRNDGYSLFDDVFNTPFFTGEALMKTDITEKDGIYTLKTDLPGYAKDDVKMSLYNGNLTIEASRSSAQEDKDDKGRVIRTERYSGTYSRTFYVGDNVREDDIHASFENGVLTIEVPKAEEKKIEEKRFITIE